MSIGLLFWVLMILWLVLGFVWNREAIKGGNYGLIGGSLLLFILLFLLGWRAFGFVIQN